MTLSFPKPTPLRNSSLLPPFFLDRSHAMPNEETALYVQTAPPSGGSRDATARRTFPCRSRLEKKAPKCSKAMPSRASRSIPPRRPLTASSARPAASATQVAAPHVWASTTEMPNFQAAALTSRHRVPATMLATSCIVCFLTCRNNAMTIRALAEVTVMTLYSCIEHGIVFDALTGGWAKGGPMFCQRGRSYRQGRLVPIHCLLSRLACSTPLAFAWVL